MKNIRLFSVLLFIVLVISSCESREIIDNSSGNASQNEVVSTDEYYIEHFDTKLTESYHSDLVTSRVPTFKSGETLHIDDMMLYFRMFEMWDIDKGEFVEELKPYIVEETFNVKVPKSVVVGMLLERFDIKIDSAKSIFESKENADVLEIVPQFLGSDYFPHTSENGIITVEKGVTRVTFDRLEMVETEQGEFGETLNAYFSKESECEIAVENYGKENYKYLSYSSLVRFKKDGFQYVLYDDGIKVIGTEKFLGPKKIVIPDEIDGYPVVALGKDAFAHHDKRYLEQVVLPKHLSVIEDGLFYKIYMMEELYIPENVEVLGSSAFWRNRGLTKITVDPNNKNFVDDNGVLFNKDKTKLIYYPEGKTEQEYIIPSTVVQLDYIAFGYKTALKRITIPASVTKFPDYNMFDLPHEVTLIVEKGTEAEKYAIKWDLNYEVIN